MPSYEYRCEEHGPVAVWKPMAEATDPEWCPRCEKPMDKLVPLVNARVKGGTPGYHRPR